jgi:hypothetical protein
MSLAPKEARKTFGARRHSSTHNESGSGGDRHGG